MKISKLLLSVVILTCTAGVLKAQLLQPIITSVPLVSNCLRTATQNAQISQVNINNPSILPAVGISSFSFTAGATTNVQDISQARLYSTGSNPNFSSLLPVSLPVINPGRTITISGLTTLLPGNNYFWLVYDISSSAVPGNLISGGLVAYTLNSILQTLSPTVPQVGVIDPLCPPCDSTRSWVYQKAFDDNGGIIAEKKAYVDKIGRESQTIQKCFSTGGTLATQVLYDVYGRPVIKTLPAPVNSFCYSDNFITSNSSNYKDNYSYGIDNYPASVDSFSILGRYYSGTNQREPYVASSRYPFAMTAYTKDPNAGVLAISSPGEQLKLGNGHENKIIQALSGGELDYVVGKNKSNIKAADADTLLTLVSTESKVFKTISIDPDNKEMISFSNAQGQTLAKCSSGISSLSNTIGQKINIGGFIDVHVSSTEINSIQLPTNLKSSSGNSVATFNFIFKIEDLKTNRLLVQGVDYTINSSNYLIFSSQYTGKSGIFRISMDLSETDKYDLEWVYGIDPPFSTTYALCNYKNDYSDWTVNFFDLKGQLIKTVPPTGVDVSYIPGSGLSNTYQSPLAIIFKYDSIGRMIERISPDEGSTKYKYDFEGKLRFSQNAQQRLTGKFSYSNYDRAGRVVETGEYNPYNFGTLTNYYFDNPVPNAQPVSLIIDQLDALNDVYCSQQIFTGYDLPATDLPAITGYTQTYLKGRISYTKNDNNTTWYSYDDMGRTIWIMQNNIELGVKTMNYSYNFQGNLLQTIYQKEVPTERFYHHFEYDLDQRLSIVSTSNDGISKTQQAKYIYYTHGPLKRVELATNLQGTDYVYTINGWLKSINSPTLTNDPGKDGAVGNTFAADVFGETLDYFYKDYSRGGTGIGTYVNEGANTGFDDNFSGLIKAVRWNTAEPANSGGLFSNDNLMYGFNYDKLNRLTKARFGTLSGTSGLTLTQQTDYRLDYISYDLNGNITSLKRDGNNTSGLSMDNLNYSYSANTNKLDHVSDATTGNYSADIKNQQAGNYHYNAIGQMTADLIKDDSLQYNIYGKVTGVYSLSTGLPKLTFTYNDRQQRVSKTRYVNGNFEEETMYVNDGAGNVLSVYTYLASTNGVYQSEVTLFGSKRIGLLRNTTLLPAITINPAQISLLPRIGVFTLPAVYLPKPIYELSDHLGNVRATISKNILGSLEVQSYTDYYPHGSPLPGRNFVSSPQYRYDYQGIEKDQETGLNNFDLRMYDSDLARWTAPDPYHQFASPYLAMGNNPINMIDPDGGRIKLPGLNPPIKMKNPWDEAREIWFWSLFLHGGPGFSGAGGGGFGGSYGGGLGGYGIGFAAASERGVMENSIGAYNANGMPVQMITDPFSGQSGYYVHPEVTLINTTGGSVTFPSSLLGSDESPSSEDIFVPTEEGGVSNGTGMAGVIAFVGVAAAPETFGLSLAASAFITYGFYQAFTENPYPKPWNTERGKPLQIPKSNMGEEGGGDHDPYGNFKTAVKWSIGIGLGAKLYDEYSSHMQNLFSNNSPIVAPRDKTKVIISPHR